MVEDGVALIEAVYIYWHFMFNQITKDNGLYCDECMEGIVPSRNEYLIAL